MDRAERRHRNQKIARKRLPYLKQIYKHKLLDIPASKIGRCVNHHPYDCGHTQCYACHSDKIDDIPTMQKRRSDLDWKEYNK
jgi:hypothetical protein